MLAQEIAGTANVFKNVGILGRCEAQERDVEGAF